MSLWFQVTKSRRIRQAPEEILISLMQPAMYRQMDVLDNVRLYRRLLGLGYSVKQIANACSVSQSTVRRYLSVYTIKQIAGWCGLTEAQVSSVLPQKE